MRVRDYLGFPLLAIGMSTAMLGHHWFGLLWFWGGALVMSLGLAIIASGGLEAKIDKALRSYRGPSDYGSREYHRGVSHGHSHDSGGDGGGD